MIPSAADKLTASIIKRAQAAGIVISSEIRRSSLAMLRRLMKGNPAPQQLLGAFLRDFRIILHHFEPVLARTVSDAQLAAWLEGGAGVLQQIPDIPMPAEPAFTIQHAAIGGPKPIVTFPAMDTAITELTSRRLLTADELYAEVKQSKEDGFTVARTSTLDALEKMRDALAGAVVDQQELRTFRIVAAEAFDSSRLALDRQEIVFRDGLMRKYARGQKAVVEQPSVQSVAVFVLRSEIDDSRLTPLCRELSHSGIEGTSIYCVEDPVWRLVAPPSHRNCRCGAVFMPVARAAAKGLRVAQKWLATGIRPPDAELFVPVPRVVFPPGWVSAWAA